MITLFLLHPLKQIPVQVWSFENESVIRIGRSSDNHVILYSAVVSRHHVELRRTGEKSWEIVNLGTNGTYLDGKRVNQIPVVDGVIIRLARSGPNLQIRLGSEALQEYDALSTRTYSQQSENAQPGNDLGEPHATLDPNQSPISSNEKDTSGRPSINRLPEQAIAPHNEATSRVSSSPLPQGLSIRHRFMPPSSLQPGNFASTAAATKITRTLANSRMLSPDQCPHERRGALFCEDCGQPLHVLKTVGDYQLVQVLGQGAVGITYLAWCRGQTLVLKTLRDRWIGDPKAHTALEAEATLLGQINHPRIPHLIEFLVEDDVPYLVIDMVNGRSLAQWVETNGAAPINQAAEWMRELCKILSYLHTFDPPILHRGIHPSSIICQDRFYAGKISLVDFGAIKPLLLGSGIPPDRTAYLAPEQFSLDATPAADLYGIAPLMAFLITRQDPVSFYRPVGDVWRFVGEAVPDIPAALAQMFTRLTAPNPGDRYQDALDLEADLQAFC
ncbi:MAG: FHA domain-containing protein [Synechococcales cyanobacterium T60_A2020_003]|nr:FHA domain-containing protein [Synechococcales cyanobacterium T60_A2020_003]